MRLDNYLVENKIAESRSKAQYYIKSGVIRVNNLIITKNSYNIESKDTVVLVENPCIFVSRGGLKLEKAIKEFNISFKDKVILDIGASTGGFTDCALTYGAKKVYAVDVGHSQLHNKLLVNSNVINLEGLNLKDIKSAMFPDVDIVVVDVSFISLSHVLKVLVNIMKPQGNFIALIKPQFEAGRQRVSKGVVKHSKEHIRVLNEVIGNAEYYSFSIKDLTYSPYKGQAGNIEFLANFIYKTNTKHKNININEIVKLAHSKLK